MPSRPQVNHGEGACVRCALWDDDRMYPAGGNAVDLEALRAHLLAKPGTVQEHPFGPEAMVFKVADKMFAALADAKINIENITTSEIKLSCIIDQKDGQKALRVVHDAFDLGGKKSAKKSRKKTAKKKKKKK